MPITFSTRIKMQLRLAVQRLRLVQQKETATAKKSRKEMAQLLEAGKEQSARIRVENIIRQDVYVELLEILELYCELLMARAGMLDNKTCEPGLLEAVQSIIYAAPHTEIKELQSIRELLIVRFGREFAREAVENSAGKVNPKVVSKLSMEPPPERLVVLYLVEIARAYDVEYHPVGYESLVSSDDENSDEDNEPKDGGIKEPSEKQLEPPLGKEPSTPSDRKASVSSTLSKESRYPITVIPSASTTDNPRPHVVVPRRNSTTPPPVIVRQKVSEASKPIREEVNGNNSTTSFDDLQRRFQALKRR